MGLCDRPVQHQPPQSVHNTLPCPDCSDSITPLVQRYRIRTKDGKGMPKTMKMTLLDADLNAQRIDQLAQSIPIEGRLNLPTKSRFVHEDTHPLHPFALPASPARILSLPDLISTSSTLSACYIRYDRFLEKNSRLFIWLASLFLSDHIFELCFRMMLK